MNEWSIFFIQHIITGGRNNIVRKFLRKRKLYLRILIVNQKFYIYSVIQKL